MITRRDFVHAGCATAAVTLAPSFLDVAEAHSIHGAVSGFNGGRSQVNPNFLQTGGDYPFLNAMKTAQSWGFSDNTNAPVTPDLLDANGYPTTIIHGGVNTAFFVPTQAERPGNYVITWTGNGTVSCGMSNTLVSGSKTGTGGSGRYVFSTTDSRFVIGISALPVTNMQVFHADDEVAINAGQVFGVKFKQRLVEANFGVIRFLNWQGNSISGGNSTNVTTWATRKPVGYVFYNDYELRQSMYCTTSTSLTGTKYSATGPSGFSLVDKTTIHLLFAQSYSPLPATFTNGSSSIQVTNHGLAVNAKLAWDTDFNGGSPPANFSFSTTYFVVSVIDANHIAVSATQGGTAIVAGAGASGNLFACPFLTLNVSGSGDVNILGESSTLLLFELNNYPISGTFQSLATLTYDADINAWIKQGGDAAINSAGLNNGVPPELMVQLCKEVGAHPYFISPPFACTPMTDWHTQLATYIKANGPSWMIPRFEGCNELWNTAANFIQTGYANAKATAYGWGPDFHNWYGRAISTIGQAINAVYGGTPGTQTKYQVICGVQTSQGDTSGDRANSNPRLASTLYLAQTPQAGYTASAASGWVTHLCCAQYFNPSDQGQPVETTLAAAFAGKAFVASIASGVMTATAINAGGSAPFAVGDTIFGTQIFAVGGPIPSGVTITSFGTGTGGLGTYNISNSSITVASQNMTAAADLTAPNTYADTSNSGSGSFTITACIALYVGWKSFAQSFGIQKMCGYEGGYSPDFTSGGGSQIDMLKSASKLDPNLSTFITTLYGGFVGLTGSGFVAEFPSCFQFSGSVNFTGFISDAWSVLDDVYQTPNPPQWNAIVAFNH